MFRGDNNILYLENRLAFTITFRQEEKQMVIEMEGTNYRKCWFVFAVVVVVVVVFVVVAVVVVG